MKKPCLYTLLCCLSFTVLFSHSTALHAQEYEKSRVDTSTNMIWTGASFGYQFPFGELSHTFKNNFNLGTGFTFKTASNWTWSVNFNYMFGSKLALTKDNYGDFMHTLFGSAFDSQGHIFDAAGLATTVYFEGRYWNLGAGFGKIIPVSKKWRNSGICLQASFGFLQHKIFIDIPDPSSNWVPAFDKEYKKGYDRRSSGLYMSQFVGYLFMQRVRVVSFYAGVEIYEMWTKPDRNYIFNVGPTENMKREFSALLGFKLGWVVPLYEKKKSIKYYTY